MKKIISRDFIHFDFGKKGRLKIEVSLRNWNIPGSLSIYFHELRGIDLNILCLTISFNYPSYPKIFTVV